MTKQEIEQFIEIMKEVCEDWTPEEVQEKYGDLTLKEAVYQRLYGPKPFFEFVEEVVVKDLEAMGRTAEAASIKKYLNT